MILPPRAVEAPAMVIALLLSLLFSMLPLSMEFVIPAALTRNASELISKLESSTLTESVFALLLNPDPAVILPAELNWT